MWRKFVTRRKSNAEDMHTRVIKLLISELGRKRKATVVVLGKGTAELVTALGDARATWAILDFAEDVDKLHAELAALPTVDAIIDPGPSAGRLRRFRFTVFHLRRGGLYVIPGGAAEWETASGEFGAYLAEAAALPNESLRKGPRRSINENSLRAVRRHIQVRAVGPDLVLSHNLADVRVKLAEPQTNTYSRLTNLGHRVIEVRPAVTPPKIKNYSAGPRPRTPRVDGKIESTELFLREYRKVIVGTEQLVMTERAVVSDSFRHHRRRYLDSRSLVDVAPRFAIPKRRLLEEPELLTGTYLHLDNEVRGHFGHLMTETLSRVWSWRAAQQIDPDVRVIVGATRIRPEIAEWEFGFYEACGIPRDRIVKIDRYVRVERLLSGTPMFSIPEYVHPGIAEVWDEVGDRLAAQATQRDWPRRFFVARRGHRRSCTNAEVVEGIFAEHGFAVVYPEDYPLADQIALFRQADAVGGWCGSGTFHLALVPEPKHLIRVGPITYRPRNELLIAAVRGHRVDDVTCSGVEDDSPRAPFTFNLEREGPYLHRVLQRVASGAGRD